MQRFQSELDRFAADAEQVLGTTPVVITLEETEWVCHLARLAEPVGAVGTWVPRIGPESNGTDVCDWFGELELGRGTPDHVFVRRVPWLGPYGEVEGSTLVAGITREAVDRVVTLGRSLWRDWRRREGGVRSPRGRHIDVDPVDWSDVVIPPSLLDDIRRNVLRFADAEPLYRRLRLPYRRGLLFYGAPGNGKTMLCRAIVTALGWPVIYVSPTSRGHAPDDIGAAFRQASELAPCVLWFDDVDCMFDTDATMSNFLNRLDGASAPEGTLVLATTNRPERLDPALVARPSRFDRIFEIAAPRASERDRFFADRFGDRLTATARAGLVELTSGMSMAFVQEVFVGAALRAMERGELPTEHDAREVLALLTKHVRTADRHFEPDQGTGFGR